MDAPMQKAPDEKYCFECGALIRARAEICPKCGVRQQAPIFSAGGIGNLGAIAPNGKSKLAAALFALFLGWIGIHKFYLGQIGMGIVYVLFCWTAIPAIVGFIEGILLLVMSDEDFVNKYGSN
jgi:TM2 domain-containing membrane protein YozV/ribosomal protein L40E